MNNTEKHLIGVLRRKIERSLDYFEKTKDREETINSLLKFIIAERIRAIRRIRPIEPTIARNNDDRALLVEKVTAIQTTRMYHNIKEQIDMLDSILRKLGGVTKTDRPKLVTNKPFKFSKRYDRSRKRTEQNT